ncbi:MAG: SocA family protein [Fibromonadaceae bacterium]|jgi:uncharacterized phage-associated protein|nr:SocA family protein [Fibromonadaceae bacterium]
MVTDRFSFLKIQQALYYIQGKAPPINQDRFNIVYLLKMIFFSDRYHLRNFGITATGDDYYAMKLGPVASSTFDMLKGRSNERYLSSIQEIDEYNVEIKQQEEDELSDSFKEAINFALKEFGDCDWKKISDISHCYPEWKKHESELSGFKRVQMNEIDFFDDPDDSLCFAKFGKKNDPFKDDKEYLSLRKKHYDAYHVSR